ncbi:hydroxymethylglutaryl-CoA synthase [Paracoccidioides brasiliensis]|uniref:Hydroxymethylglutaryl-CoA synthase n=1 Tax=Paracoccidioides brasiliensis TaxID=121759 RepID=A0A1D2J306_PARBR|nr:hydroxymethylglutaryl-CoA synthase [Paracoccidioides brasiliensis]
MSSRPQNIGIKAIEIYFPSQCVDQAELEKFDGVGQGKYTIGLGQTKMSFCDDREDIYSMSLTTLSSLLRKYSIDPKSIGRLEVGTETLLDKSKSVKSVLMQLFAESGNTNVEGVDTVNACYGGTNAVFNSINWLESSAWDGRDAVVVTGDIALYKKGAARPTGGAGCIAMLIGPDAPIVFEPGLRGSHITHAYDFYKPDLTSEYPYVDGHYSIRCYTQAVDSCYKAYNAREKVLKAQSTHQQNGHAFNNSNSNSVNGNGAAPATGDNDDSNTPLDRFDHVIFHAPTCKLVAKSYARLLYNDFLADPAHPAFAEVPAELRDLDYEASLSDRNVEKAFMALTKKRFGERVQPSIEVPTMCGNMYCASVYGGLVSLLANATFDPAEKVKRVGIFSYGSGLASSMFSVKVVGDVSTIVEKIDLKKRLAARKTVAPEVYNQMCLMREHAHLKKDFVPAGNTDTIVSGTYYLTKVDDMFRREYEIKA